MKESTGNLYHIPSSWELPKDSCHPTLGKIRRREFPPREIERTAIREISTILINKTITIVIEYNK